METLKLDKPTAIKLYATAAPEFKTMLETTFGKNTFSGKITDRIGSLKDILDIAGISFIDCTPYPSPSNKRQNAVNGIEQTMVAVEVLNEGWKPNWDNSSEPKYEIWWDMRSGGLVFTCVSSWNQHSDVGSRLCFRDATTAKWAAQQSWFIELCKKYMCL